MPPGQVAAARRAIARLRGRRQHRGCSIHSLKLLLLLHRRQAGRQQLLLLLLLLPVHLRLLLPLFQQLPPALLFEKRQLLPQQLFLQPQLVSKGCQQRFLRIGENCWGWGRRRRRGLPVESAAGGLPRCR